MHEAAAGNARGDARVGGYLTRSTIWRFVLALGVLGSLALRLQLPLADALLPLLKSEIQWLDDTFRVDRLYVTQDGLDHVIRIEVGLAHRLVMNGHVVDPDPRGTANASTLVSHVLVPTILMIAVAFAPAAKRRLAYAWRAMALVPAVVFMWMIDVPFILLASLWGLVIQVLDPGRFSGLRMWSVFLQGGGELALAVILGVLIGALDGLPRSRSERSAFDQGPSKL